MIPLADTNRIPDIGTPERSRQESEAYERGTALVHENDGRLCNALHDLEQELEGHIWERTYPQTARDYTRALVSYVEQCWATRIVS